MKSQKIVEFQRKASIETIDEKCLSSPSSNSTTSSLFQNKKRTVFDELYLDG